MSSAKNKTLILQTLQISAYPKRRRPVFWILILVMGIHQALWSGEIRGRVVVARAPANQSTIMSRTIIQRYAERRPSHAEDMSHSRVQTPAIVYLTGVPNSPDANRPPMVMDQRHEQFIPHVLPIVVGTTVRFRNSEEVYHNVFSLSRAKTFNLGRYPKGQYRDVVFDKPGAVSVYCDIHTHMNAFILVLPNSCFAAIDAEGYYQLRNIPAGEYEIKIWHPNWPEKTQKIVVDENGVTEVNFVLP